MSTISNHDRARNIIASHLESGGSDWGETFANVIAYDLARNGCFAEPQISFSAEAAVGLSELIEDRDPQSFVEITAMDSEEDARIVLRVSFYPDSPGPSRDFIVNHDGTHYEEG